MTYQDIYNIAAAFIAENASGDDTDDLMARALPIVNSAVTGLWELNNAYLVSNNGEAVSFDSFAPATSLTAAFPLSVRLAPCAAFFCGARLIADENPELSAELEKGYGESLAGVVSEVSAQIGPITDAYA